MAPSLLTLSLTCNDDLRETIADPRARVHDLSKTLGELRIERAEGKIRKVEGLFSSQCGFPSHVYPRDLPS